MFFISGIVKKLPYQFARILRQGVWDLTCFMAVFGIALLLVLITLNKISAHRKIRRIARQIKRQRGSNRPTVYISSRSDEKQS